MSPLQQSELSVARMLDQDNRMITGANQQGQAGDGGPEKVPAQGQDCHPDE